MILNGQMRFKDVELKFFSGISANYTLTNGGVWDKIESAEFGNNLITNYVNITAITEYRDTGYESIKEVKVFGCVSGMISHSSI